MKVELQNITAGYGKKLVLTDLTQTFEAGKIHGIIGANGSGKSTLIKLLAGVLPPTGGEIKISDKPLINWNRKNLAQKLAFLPQNPQAPEEITVEQLIKLGRFPHSKSKKHNAIVEEVLSEIKLTHLCHRAVATLSGGERRKAFLGLVLAQQPDLLILDEPTVFLDWQAKLEFYKILQNKHKNQNLTVIMSIHDLNEAVRYCHTITALKNQRIAETGVSSDVLSLTTLKTLFDISFQSTVASDNFPVFLPDLQQDNSN